VEPDGFPSLCSQNPIIESCPYVPVVESTAHVQTNYV
jgi:hypothetical protein